MVTSEDVERILIASWLQKEHLEDAKLFEASDFPTYSEVLQCIKRGKAEPYEVAKECSIGPVGVNDLQTKYAPAMYDMAMADLVALQARKWVSAHPGTSPEEIAEAMQKFQRTSSEIPKPPDDPVAMLIDDFNARRDIPFVATGISDLDAMLGGIRRKELTAIGARPSVGKSAFVQQVAMKVARDGRKVLFFPLEMSNIAVLERMFMRYTNIPQREVRAGITNQTWADPQTMATFEKVQEFFEKGNLLIFERCNDLQTIRELVKIHKPYMIVIDQLEQLKDGNRFWKDKRERFSHMTHELQALAMDMDIAVWLACQVNRSANESVPTMANLKESGSIEEDSDNVILLHRDGDKTERQSIRLELAKQRGGECGAIELVFIAPKYTFYGVNV